MVFEKHRRFSELFKTPLQHKWLPHNNSRNPDRCLQIGFVSGDFRMHALAHFLSHCLHIWWAIQNCHYTLIIIM